MRRLKALVWFAGAGLTLAVVAAIAFLVWADRYLDTPVHVAVNDRAFRIESGQTFREVSENLAERGIVLRPLLFSRYAQWTGRAGGIHAGDYLLDASMSPRDLLEKFAAGDVRLYSFTIIEGWNQWDLLRELHEHPELEATLTVEDWPGFLRDIEALAEHPEGLFLPETYRFPGGTSDRELLAQAHELLQEVLAEEWAARSEAAPVTSPYEALILASIIEKETALADERARIAGVFARRLGKRMRLQTDPTVIYGIMPDFDGNLRRRDLRTDTPYNTYTRRGLPPTPIAMAGRAAIHAALHPADGDELFFVATGLDDGSHAFSRTKEEHDAAVAEYLQRLRNRRRSEP